jgi:hypothetical protein
MPDADQEAYTSAFGKSKKIHECAYGWGRRNQGGWMGKSDKVGDWTNKGAAEFLPLYNREESEI